MDKFIDELDAFLEEYSDSLWPEHKKKLMKAKEFIYAFKKAKRIESRFGNHYDICIWADNEAVEGPDTCICYHIEDYKQDCTVIIKWYQQNKTVFLK